MSILTKMAVMPSKLKYKLVVSFCLMSLLPILSGVYVASLFIKFPFELTSANLAATSLVLIFSLAMSLLGYYVAKQVVYPIIDAGMVAKNIAEGRWDIERQIHEIKGADELEDLSRSLHTISTNARELLQKVEKLSMKDKLTGLYNATYIRERLQEEIQRSIHYQRPCAFAYLAIDGFDGYTARYGEAASEDVLKAMAKVFGKRLSEFDRAARITKDEFAIILPDKNKKTAIEFVEAMKREVAEHLLAKPNGQKIHFTVSIGISENPLDGVTGNDLFRIAQERMNAARKRGSNLLEAFA
ncbi:MAG: GGDEF domain-containing protein [Candidatus Omnitrophica bacterium]|nr:GGDEF domain-containing protein [Candidatus Omnitrophota bacterium]